MAKDSAEKNFDYGDYDYVAIYNQLRSNDYKLSKGMTFWHFLAQNGKYAALIFAIMNREFDPETVLDYKGNSVWKYCSDEHDVTWQHLKCNDPAVMSKILKQSCFPELCFLFLILNLQKLSKDNVAEINFYTNSLRLLIIFYLLSYDLKVAQLPPFRPMLLLLVSAFPETRDIMLTFDENRTHKLIKLALEHLLPNVQLIESLMIRLREKQSDLTWTGNFKDLKDEYSKNYETNFFGWLWRNKTQARQDFFTVWKDEVLRYKNKNAALIQKTYRNSSSRKRAKLSHE